MRDCVFLLADSNMKGSFEGFFSRDSFHLSLACGSFDFDSTQDIIVAAGDNDPGLYTRGHELLRTYQKTHRHAIVVIDAEWDGSPGASSIRDNMINNIRKTGWLEESFRVIVIDPELEVWIWQQNEHVAEGLGYSSFEDLMSDTTVRTAWPQGQPKPVNPKETLEAALKKKRIPRSSAIYKQITGCVTVRNCQDAAFQEMLEALRAWFPAVVR